MAIPTLRRDKRGTIYLHWSEQRRSKRVSTRTTSMAEAEDFLLEWMRLQRAEEARPKRSVTFAACWAAYLDDHVETRVVAKRPIRSIGKRLAGHFGPMAISEITQQVVDAYIAARRRGAVGKPAKQGTIACEVTFLKAAVRWGVKRGLVPAGDVAAIETPRHGPPKTRWLTADEIARVEAAARDLRAGDRLSRLERFIALALETAGRKTALYELRWEQVDFTTGMIHLNPDGRAQTSKRRASVPISARLLPVLERAFHERVSAYVLDSTTGIERALDAACRQAGVQGVTPHVFRHTAATHMARAGVPLFDIAGVLGNTTAMVEKVYAKHSPDRLLRAVNARAG